MEIQHLPKGWTMKRLGDIFDFLKTESLSREQLTYEQTKSNIKYIHYGDIHVKYKNQVLDIEKTQNIPLIKDDIDISKIKSWLKEGDLIIADASEDYEGTGACIELKNVGNEKVIGGLHTIAIRDITNETILGFRGYLFKNPFVSIKMKQMVTGFSVYGISKTNLSNLEIILPKKEEQKKIAEILSTWDEAIQTTQNLIKKLETRKNGLMQRLLSGKTRLKGFEKSKWQVRELSELITPIIREVPKPNKAFLGLGLRSHGKGTFLKHNFDPEKIEMEYLYQVRENDLIVNITFAWEGAIAIASLKDDKALVSHRFPTYTFNNTESSREYFRHFLNYPRFRFSLILISPGGAGRNRVMSKKDFLTLAFKFPPIEEQTAIAEILNIADAELNETKAYLETLKQQKKGLMQQLLTGKIRVKTDG